MYDLERIASEQIDVVRRPTGGRAILHYHEITYCVTGPDAFAPSLTSAYDRVNELLLAALRSLGTPVEIAQPSASAPKPDQSPCFAVPVKGELVALGKKLVGSAQFREDGAFLQHGSILVENDQNQLYELTLDPKNEAASSPTTLSELISATVTARVVADALFDAVRTVQDPDATAMDEMEIRDAALVRRLHFLDPLWTWRR